MKTTVSGLQIELIQGDITELDVDAIVNAANSSLVLGAGVAGAIYSKGGQIIQDECNAIGHCSVGKAVITTGGSLKARHVIHAVGPRMGEGDEEKKLASAVSSSLQLAEKHKLEVVALPAISTGVFGFPMQAAAEIITRAVFDYAFEMRAYLKQVIICLFDAVALKIFRTALEEVINKLDTDNQDSTLLLDD
jgi:O-acetyl-ADP-ribose deacetylase